MTLPDDLMKAARELALKRLHDHQCGCGQDDVQYVMADETEFELIVECAVAAVLRALPTSESVVEELADVEHERWAKWMRWVYQHGEWNDDGSFTIQPDRAERWRFLSQIAYADLDSETQEHDRVEARTSLATIAKLADEGRDAMTGAELIAAERQRQVEKEGWTPEHDDEHDECEMLLAALCYANRAGLDLGMTGMEAGQIDGSVGGPPGLPHEWPWHPDWWKPSDDPIRNLVKAGALIAAEIDRLQRRPTP